MNDNLYILAQKQLETAFNEADIDIDIKNDINVDIDINLDALSETKENVKIK